MSITIDCNNECKLIATIKSTSIVTSTTLVWHDLSDSQSEMSIVSTRRWLMAIVSIYHTLRFRKMDDMCDDVSSTTTDIAEDERKSLLNPVKWCRLIVTSPFVPRFRGWGIVTFTCWQSVATLTRVISVSRRCTRFTRKNGSCEYDIRRKRIPVSTSAKYPPRRPSVIGFISPYSVSHAIFFFY